MLGNTPSIKNNMKGIKMMIGKEIYFLQVLKNRP